MRLSRYFLVLFLLFSSIIAQNNDSASNKNHTLITEDSFGYHQVINKADLNVLKNYGSGILTKTNNEIKMSEYLIDSILTHITDVKYYKDVYQYDLNGNIISWFNFVWNNNKSSRRSFNYYNFDQNDKLISDIWEWWAVSNDSLMIKVRNSYFYGANGRLGAKLMEKFENNNWLRYDSTTFTYDINNLLIVDSLYAWHKDHWEKPRLHDKYNYDSNSNLIEILHGIGKSSSREIYQYDDFNNKILDLEQIWGDSVWVNVKKNTYTYGPNNNMMVEVLAFWELPLNDWYKCYKYSYTYNDKNKKLLKLVEAGNRDNENWVNYARNHYEYDKNDHLISELIEGWDGVNWVTGKVTGIYFYLDEITPFYEPCTGSKLEIFYNPATSVSFTSNKVPADLTISPNPVSGILNINYTIINPGTSRITITNILGIPVGKIPPDENPVAVNGKFKFDTSTLPSGIYFCTLQTPECTITKQFVVVR